jgi:membrane fusion protein (multidrug efflux system)
MVDASPRETPPALPPPSGGAPASVAAPNAGSGKQRRRFLLIAAVVVSLVTLVVLLVLRPWSPWEGTDDAFLEAKVTQVAPQVSGRVLRVLVDDNARVAAGHLLLEIDDRDLRVRVDQARAALGVAAARHSGATRRLELSRTTTQARIREAEAEVSRSEAHEAQARAEVLAVQAQSARAAADLARYERLDPKSISKQQLDLARRSAEEAKAQLEAAWTRVTAAAADTTAARERLTSARAAPIEIAERREEVRQDAALEEQARATLAEAELALSYARVTAPVGGRVTRKSVEPGDYVVPGQTLLVLVQPDLWTVANFKETQLVHMAPGQVARISIDSLGGRTFGARVESIQAGSGARFSLFPPENATGNYVKVVQRVPVKIVFDRPDELQPLHLGPGMSVEAEVRAAR